MKLRSLHTTKILEFYAPDYSTKLNIPFGDVGISAGFPSPADDFIELSIDLNKHLIKHKDSTFFAKVKGHSMKDAGIYWLLTRVWIRRTVKLPFVKSMENLP